MDKLYLDLNLILQRFRQSGELRGEIPAKKLGNKALWKARLRLVEGSITVCQILDHKEAVVNSGELALEALAKLGPIYWEIIPDPAGSPGAGVSTGTSKLPLVQATRKPGSGRLTGGPERMASPPQIPVPYRLVNITLKQMNQTQWPRDYRMVYILIDGTRSSEKIAGMLALPLPKVVQILADLKSMRFIEIET